MVKICNNCKIEKSSLDFSKCVKKVDGLNIICKSCFNEKYRMSKEDKKEYYKKNKNKWNKYYEENKESISEYKKEYREENSEKIKENSKKYIEENREKLKIKWREYRENNKEKINKWFENNKEYRKEYKEKYRNREDIKSKRNSDRKERKKIDKVYLIKENTRSRIYNLLKSKGYKKNLKTEIIVGCSFEELKLYLESKFETWMNWDNYGLYNGKLNYGWDIYHIIPLCSALKEEDVIKLNHYTNLQPLCSKVNRDIKHSNIV